VISDALNHASIIDGVRLCKARRYRYSHADMADLETKLEESADARTRLIATDGVFSMDGDIAPLDEILALAQRHDARVMVDDSHATGFVGPTGRGSAEHHGVQDQVDIFTSTLGKALGGASGGFTTASREIVAMLRQRSRPYLFSNTLPPPLVAAGIQVFELLSRSPDLRNRLTENTRYFRAAQTMAAELLECGIYVIGFSYPVVPKGRARIRVQLSAAHEHAHLERAIEAFAAVGTTLGIIH
jgi:glycine C-acetyltransferase